MEPTSAQSPAPFQWPPEVLERIHRVFEYHQASKLTFDSYHAQPPPDLENQPTAFINFAGVPKIQLPTNLISADAPTLSLLFNGRSSLPESQLDPPHDLRTLATWLFLSDGLTQKQREGERVTWARTLCSQGNTYPDEIYVAAFAVGGLEPGLYHYNPRDFSLRLLRAGLEVLGFLKHGRAELEFLKTVPAAILVSTVFARSSWMYHKRGYRTALLDAGHLVENLMQSAAALGMQTSARLRVDDVAMRELIGISPDATFEQAEAVQALVAWTDAAPEPVPPPTAPDQPFPPIARPPLAKSVVPYGSILAVHEDCVAPGAMMVRELRPPLTELSPLPGNVPAYERAPIEEPSGGKGVGPLLMKRRPVQAFHRKAISRDEFLAINKLALRGPAYYPLVPDGLHAGLVRPIWILHDVVGLDPGLWYYHPQIDRWSMLVRGNFRLETAYLSREQNLAADASAVCVLIANIHYLIQTAGPDAYRLAHLEAGIVAHRMQLTAEAQHLGAYCNASFYDEELRKFLGLEQSGWEILYQVFVGEPVDEEHPGMADSFDDEHDWKD
jgi:SagB-type dehydrogenase family enzyme